MTRSVTSSLPKKFLLSACVLTMIVAGVGLTACSAERASPTETSQAQSQDRLKPDPALVTGTLENGVRYAVLQNATPPGTAALRVQFDSGSLNEVPGTEGLAHYLEHMAFNGSKNVPEGEMIQILERLGLSFGADTNASTGLDRTIYKLNLPTLDEEVLDAAFMLMGETAYNLTLDQDAIERELGIILSEKRTRDTANYRAWEARMRFYTQGSDLMDRLPIGTEASLNTITAPDFKAYYDAHYHPEKTIVAFVGDKDPAEIIAYIEATFGDWTPATAAGEDMPASPKTDFTSRVDVYAEDGLPTNISLLALRPYVKREDSITTRTERLIDSLGSGLMRYRMSAIAEKADRPFINASMAPLSVFELSEGMSFTAYTQPENWETALVGLDQELRKALQFGFTQAELDAQLARIQSAYEARAEGADTRATTSRMGGLIDALMSSFDNERVFTHPDQELEWFMSVRDEISLDDVNTALRDAWGDIDNLSVFMNTDTSIENPKDRIRDVLQQSRETPVVADAMDDMASEFTYTNFGEPGAVVSDVYKADIDSHLIKFANNVRLNFKKTDFDEDRVLVQLQFGDGNLSTPRKDEGLRRMMFGVMGDSGYQAHSVSETRRLMAGKLVATPRIGNREDSDTFSMAVQTVPDNFRDQLNLYTALFTAAGYTEDSRTNHINKLKAWYPRHDTTLGGVRDKAVNRIIHSGDKRFGFDDEDMFYAPTLADVQNWMSPQLETGLIEITVIGDIDKDAVVKHVAATLGALPPRADARGDYPDMRDVEFPKNPQSPYKLYHRGDDNQAQLRIYWPASDGMDAGYSRRLSVLRAVLRNRMVSEIREGEATTYSPQAGSSASTVFPGYGYVVAILTLKPEDIDPMTEKLLSITDDIANGTVTEDEFNRAVKPILERMKSSDKTNNYWASVLADAQTDGMGLARHSSRDSDYAGMSAADIQALAQEVFVRGSQVEIQLLPTTDEG